MEKRLCRSYFAGSVLLGLAVGAFAPLSAQAGSCTVLGRDGAAYSYQHVRVKGKCRRYFVKGRQVKLLPKNLACPVVTQVPARSGCALPGCQVAFAAFFKLSKPLFPALSEPGEYPSCLIPPEEEHKQLGVASADESGRALLRRVRLRKAEQFYAIVMGLYPPLLSATAKDCSQAVKEMRQEEDKIRACTSDLDCGQVLSNTSCGCTREKIANNSADASKFYELLERVGKLGCDYEDIITTCDCPPANGFVCKSGRCEWNYVSTEEPEAAG